MSKRQSRKRPKTRVLVVRQKPLSFGNALAKDLHPVAAISKTLRAEDREVLDHVLEMTVEEIVAAQDDEGVVRGSLAVAARYVVEQLAERNNLTPDEQLALKHYLIGILGQQLHDTAASLDAFRTWDAARHERVTQ